MHIDYKPLVLSLSILIYLYQALEASYRASQAVVSRYEMKTTTGERYGCNNKREGGEEERGLMDE